MANNYPINQEIVPRKRKALLQASNSKTINLVFDNKSEANNKHLSSMECDSA